MFDHHHYHRHDTSVHTTVTEQRAPTDESVRLLRDMEDRAEKKVLAAVRVENTPVEMVIHRRVDYLNQHDLYVAIFKVNGKQLQAEFRASDCSSRQEVATGIRDAVAKQIASLICAVTMQQTFNKFDFNH